MREPHELAPDVQAAHVAEVMRVGRAMNEAFTPWKLSYACYGNSEPSGRPARQQSVTRGQ